MDSKEKMMLEENNKFFKKVLKSMLYTFFILLFVVFGVNFIINLIFGEMTVEQSNTWVILSISIGIIFTIFYCTFTIIEEIRRGKGK